MSGLQLQIYAKDAFDDDYKRELQQRSKKKQKKEKELSDSALKAKEAKVQMARDLQAIADAGALRLIDMLQCRVEALNSLLQSGQRPSPSLATAVRCCRHVTLRWCH